MSFRRRVKQLDAIVLGGQISKLVKGYWELSLRVKRRLSVTNLPSKNLKKSFGLRSRLAFFESAQEYLQANRLDGVYMEFGVHEANTFRMALNTLGPLGRPNKITSYWAFDSFAGMPEPEGIDVSKLLRGGMNHTTESQFRKLVRRDLHRTKIVAGYFSQSLSNVTWQSDEKVAVAYLDCDYYSSTKEALNFLRDKLTHGSILAFDDWQLYYSDPLRGQQLAFREFKGTMSDFSFVKFFEIGSGGMSFVCHRNDKLGKCVS